MHEYQVLLLRIFELDSSVFLMYNKAEINGGETMAIRYKSDVLALLKAAGYPSTRIRAEKLLGQSYVQQLRKGELISWAALNKVCSLLNCQPGDLLEYVPDEVPNAETLAAIHELDNGGGEHFTGSTEELVKKLLDEPAGEE